MYACTYWMTLKSSARDMAKCEHKLLLNVWPALVISAYTMMNGRPAGRVYVKSTLNMFVTRGIQPPQPVPTFVFVFRSVMLSMPSLMQAPIWPFRTFYTLQ
jgi:hypothetical protein